MDQRKRLVALDIGRALAILGVVAAHLFPWVPELPYWLWLLAKSGQYGVQLFFVISAFTICKTLSDDKNKCPDNSTLIRRFYLKRFARIAPLYYIGIAVYGLLDPAAARISHAHVLSEHSFWDVLKNVAFVHEFFPTAINSVVPGGWSIGVEMAFYVVAPALFLIGATRQRMLLTTATVLVASYGAILIDQHNSGSRFIVNSSFLYYWPPTQFPCFALGILAWSYFKNRFLHERANLKLMAVAGFGTVVGYAALLATGVGLNLSHAIAPFVAAATGASLLLLLAASPEALKNSKIIRGVGKMSYGIYIWHFFGILCFRLISKILGDHIQIISPVVVFIFGIMFVVAVAYALAAFTDRFIEKPVSRWVSGKLQRDPVHHSINLAPSPRQTADISR
ncbi:acyltransferase family protein [Paraburkholderia lacunae]|uniref:acyltransferase family protein n=1 Tax=Paraburkholderia lacunae TaxID=2211104 RepID=UPI0014024BEE|nr:acyltransferase [Paraburkholderia lacunae]